MADYYSLVIDFYADTLINNVTPVLNYTVTCNHVHLLVKDTGPGVIANSIQLTAGRTGQEYNQRKARHKLGGLELGDWGRTKTTSLFRNVSWHRKRRLRALEAHFYGPKGTSKETPMPRANRHFLPGYVWHITHRCHRKKFSTEVCAR